MIYNESPIWVAIHLLIVQSGSEIIMTIVPSVTAQIDEKEIFKVISNNFSKLAPYYYVMISNWLIRAYGVHNDIDTVSYTHLTLPTILLV